MKNYEILKIKNDFDVWWAGIGSSIVPLKNDDMESHAKRIADAAWVESALIFSHEHPKTTQDEIDYALDRILKASGSALKHYSMPSTIENMRAEMLAIMKRSYVDGSNACHRAITTK